MIGIDASIVPVYVYRIIGYELFIVERDGRFEWMWISGGTRSSATLEEAEADLATELGYKE